MILSFSTIALMKFLTSPTVDSTPLAADWPQAPNPVYGHSVTVQLYNQLASYQDYTIHCTLYHVCNDFNLMELGCLGLFNPDSCQSDRYYSGPPAPSVTRWIYLIGLRAMWDGRGFDKEN